MAPPPKVRGGPLRERPRAPVRRPAPGSSPGAGSCSRGSYLAGVEKVVFYGGAGRSDDAYRAGATPTLGKHRGARAGKGPQRPARRRERGRRALRRWSGLVIDDPAGEPRFRTNGPQPAIGTAISKPRKIFYGGLRKAVFSLPGRQRRADST